MMKLVHASIPADNPASAARTLAGIMQGEAMPFPPGGPDAWMAWSGDAGLELEIVPRGCTLQHDEDQGNWRKGAERGRASEVHLAIAVDRPAAEIVALAQAAGWPARLCSRGEGLFALVEVWVDGCFLIEFMDPAQSTRYETVVTPENWKAMLGDPAMA